MELVIDDILTFFFAGSKTIQITTSNLLMQLALYPDKKKKLLEELDTVFGPIADDI